MTTPPDIVEVRCAGCGETLEVERGLTEFACPDCATPQALPPELMPPPLPRPRRALPLPGRGAAAPLSARVPCGGCGALLSVPPGLGRFGCPLCGAELAASPAAPTAVSVLAPPAAVPISHWPRPPSEVREEPPSQAACAGQVPEDKSTNPIRSEQAHGQRANHPIYREEPLSSFGADSNTTINVRTTQNDLVNPLIHREESHIEPLSETITSSKKRSRFPVGLESSHTEKVEVQQPNQVIQAQGQSPSEVIAVHVGKQKAGDADVFSTFEQEQIKPPDQASHEQQADETPADEVHADQVQVESGGKRTGQNQKRKRSAKTTRWNQKRKNKGLMSPSNEGLHLRRSKRLAKEPTSLIDTEPIQQLADRNQNQSDPPDIERTITNPSPSSLPQHQISLKESDDVDATTPAASLNHGTSQADLFPHCYRQLYPPEVGGALGNPRSCLWRKHETHQESSNGTDLNEKSGAEVWSNPWQTPKQVMEEQPDQEPSSGENHSEQVQVEHQSNNITGHDKHKKSGLISSSNEGKHLGGWSISSSPRQMKFATSCSDAWRGGVQSGCTDKSSKKCRGRAPSKLIEPREEADRPVLTPNGIDNWAVHPPCPKVASTISLLIKQSYPGTSILEDQNGNDQPHEQVVYHWHQYPSDTRAAVMDAFLQRYKWAPGQEAECEKLFDRKAVRTLVNLLCFEKLRARELSVVQKAKKKKYAREDLEDLRRDQAAAELEEDNPLQWKPFFPEWMQPKWWAMLCEHWAKDEIMKVSYQKRKNRSAGNRPRRATSSRSIAMHRQEASKHCIEAAGNTHPETQPVFSPEVGSRKDGRYYERSRVLNKTQIYPISKSSPDCCSKQTQQQTFTQEQVQQMISQALQGLNAAWEKKFQSLEQSLRRMPLSGLFPNHDPDSSVAGAGAKECQLARQDTLDSLEGEKDASARDDNEDHDDYEHS